MDRTLRFWAWLALGTSAATACTLLVGTETRTVDVDGSTGLDATSDESTPDAAPADTSTDAGDASTSNDACGVWCLLQAESCGQNCVAVYNGCVAGCTNNPCKNACDASKSACLGTCVATCSGCTSGAGCPNPGACQDAAFP